MTCIASVGTALPGEPVDNATLAARLGVSERWIRAFIGTRSRHFSLDINTGDRTCTMAELGARAARQAMDRAGLTAKDVGFLVLATATPDDLMPATVNRVADLLGVNDIPTYQLQSGCAGAVQALDLGTMLIARGHRAGLVLGAESCARHLRFDLDCTNLPNRELVNYVLFGDAAGAAVLTAEPVAGGMAVRTVLNQLIGLGQQPGQQIRWYGAVGKQDDEPAIAEDYKAIERRVPVLAGEILQWLLGETEWTADDVDFLLPPQLSVKMTGRIVEELGLPRAKEISCVGETGNTGNALPFLQLDLMGGLPPGQKAAVIAVESSKWIKGGFALEGV
ncbi:3-oxoacyl-ACP synthase III family protein [Solihabitans fulvus]|uniref:3-oxoacyl-ACP synthase III family protein n=1 Tax=Solihabitans fulvus TaxID=1892852 RepID=A0A5B2X284_9PSEU|nr:3-oxoacyl-ACP synthase III family protein [Solihabitans fulvus]KAA2257262.1 3-oxoacyl-ACP synthase III family protein [Solihabitans fulvus]